MTVYTWQMQERIDGLSNELNKLKHLVYNPKENISLNTFMKALMRGGFTELVEANGGRTLRFIIRDAHGQTMDLQKFYIPDLGNINNLRGFLLSANDGRETVEIPIDASFNISLDRELLSFFQALYETLVPVFACGNEIEVQIQNDLVCEEAV